MTAGVVCLTTRQEFDLIVLTYYLVRCIIIPVLVPGD